MIYRDSVRRAAEAFLAEQLDAGEHITRESPMVVCGYTNEFLEEVLLRIAESATDRRQDTVLFPVAA